MTFTQFCVNMPFEEFPWLKRLVADFLVRKPDFDSRQVHMGFVVEKRILGRGGSPSFYDFSCEHYFFNSWYSFFYDRHCKTLVIGSVVK
jgi:hypothetical protein